MGVAGGISSHYDCVAMLGGGVGGANVHLKPVNV